MCLSRNGAQSVSLFRTRFMNRCDPSIQWHELGVAPKVNDTDTSIGTSNQPSEKLALDRAMLYQRFIFTLLQTAAEASHSAISID